MKVFIFDFSLYTQGFHYQPQSQNCRQAMKQVGWNSLSICPFSAENFRHGVDNSDKGNQPANDRGDPPPHRTLPYQPKWKTKMAYTRKRTPTYAILTALILPARKTKEKLKRLSNLREWIDYTGCELTYASIFPVEI
jgi:hypothetical protein